MSILESLNYFNKSVRSQSKLELEFRFNTIHQKSVFENIYNILLENGFERDYEKHLLKICFSNNKDYMNCETDSVENIRSEILGLSNIQGFCNTNTMSEDTIHIKKTRISSTTNKEYGFKTVLCKEIPCSEYEINNLESKFKKTPKTFRLMNRLSLRHENMPGLVVDMSIVKMKMNVSNMTNSGIFEASEQYEIEIELEEHDKQIEDIDLLSNHLKKTIKYILCGKYDTNFPISELLKQNVLTEYKNLFSQSKYANFIGPSSYTLQKANLSLEYDPCIKKDFCVTDKADGLRKLLYISKKKQIYFITNTNPIQVQFTGRTIKDDTLSEVLIDGEYIKYDKNHNRIDLFTGFDIYFYKKGDKVIDIRKEEFKHKRYPKLKEMIQKINEDSNSELYKNSIKFKNKQFYFIDEKHSLYRQCQFVLNQIDSPDYLYNTDGIIFSSSTLGVGMESKDDIVKNKKYAWKHSFKWKPPEFNTIDFLVKFPKNDQGEPLTESIWIGKSIQKYQIIHLYVGNSNSEEVINPQQELLQGPQHSPSSNKAIKFIPTNPFDKDAYMAYIPLEENGHIYVEEEKEGTTERDVIYDNNVVEFKYNMLSNEKRLAWIPLRIRFDKSYGNNKNTANSNWNSIHNPVTREMLTDPEVVVEFEVENDDVYYNKDGVKSKTTNLRDFHNKYIKKKLYNEFCNSQCNIIDFAVGKGGDLHKWLENDAYFVLGIDLSKDNINNVNDGACIRYLRQLKKIKGKTKYVFIEGNTGIKLKDDFSQGNKISKEVIDHVFGTQKSSFHNIPDFSIVKKGFDLGSIQFSLHYMFETKEMLHNFMWNCSKTIKLKGHLIGTCYDGEEVYDLLKDKEKSELFHKDGSRLWTINKKYKNNSHFLDHSQVFGYKIGVWQDSINKENDEYLVHFKYFEKSMSDYGFKMIQLNSFESYYKKKENKTKLSKEEKKISFLNKAFVFEKINDVDPDLVYNFNTKKVEELPKQYITSSKPIRLKSKIKLEKI